MEQEEKRELIVAMREEGFVTRDEMRIDIKQIVGVFAESIDEKLKVILEVVGDLQIKSDEHSMMFVELNVKLDRKADIDEVDSLDRRIAKLERKTPRPLRSG